MQTNRAWGDKMKERSALRPSIYCGLLLLLVLAITLLVNNKPIGYSKNALFQTLQPKILLEVQGDLAWAGGDSYYNYSDGSLKMMEETGKVLWDTKIKGQLLWIGEEGVIAAQDNMLLMLDGNGHEIFQKADLPDKPRVLCVQGKYLLLSGKLSGVEHGILLHDRGDIVWQIPLDGSIISGSLHPKGIYAVFSVIDNDAKSRLVVVGPRGDILIDSGHQLPLYRIRAVSQGICVITAYRAYLMDYDGRLLWEYGFQGQVLRGDIGSDGSVAAIVEEHAGSLSQDLHQVLIMLSEQGRHICSYSLDSRPNNVKVDKDRVYIVDDYGIMLLSREGLLLSKITQRGIKKLTFTDKNNIIVNLEASSLLLESPTGGI